MKTRHLQEAPCPRPAPAGAEQEARAWATSGNRLEKSVLLWSIRPALTRHCPLWVGALRDARQD